MFYFLVGVVEHLEKNLLIMNTNDIGYQIIISEITYQSILSLISKQNDKKIKLYTFMTIKDDVISLYGFWSEEEREMFTKLISVSGIGPKAGMNILSKISHENILAAVTNENIELLSTVPGIGKKTAQRLILELKGKLTKFNLNSFEDRGNFKEENFIEAQEALLNLGYSQTNVNSVLGQLKTKNPNLSTEEIIKTALKLFANKKF